MRTYLDRSAAAPQAAIRTAPPASRMAIQGGVVSGGVHGGHMSYCIIRAAKLGNTGKLRAALEHNTRERPCEKADPARTPGNEILIGTGKADDALDEHARIVANLVKQKNSVQAIEYVVACPPEAIEALDGPRDKPDGKYLKEALEWLAKRHGGRERVIHAAVHRDEESPHIHVIVVPVAKLTRRGGHTHDTLSASQYVGGKKRLAALQTEFAEGVGKLFGLVRGISKEITKRLHRPVRDWDATRVAAIESKDLDGLSPEDLKAIILRQREALGPAVQATGGIQQTASPPPSPTPSQTPKPTTWADAYEQTFTAAANGDRQAIEDFKAEVIRYRSELTERFMKDMAKEGKIDSKGMIGNRPAGWAVDKMVDLKMARLIDGDNTKADSPKDALDALERVYRAGRAQTVTTERPQVYKGQER